MQHCCFASCKALLPVLPPPQATCRATNFSVASCSNMLHAVLLHATRCCNQQRWNLLCGKLLAGVVIMATKLCNLQSNNVAQQVARNVALITLYLTLTDAWNRLYRSLHQSPVFTICTSTILMSPEQWPGCRHIGSSASTSTGIKIFLFLVLQQVKMRYCSGKTQAQEYLPHMVKFGQENTGFRLPQAWTACKIQMLVLAFALNFILTRVIPIACVCACACCCSWACISNENEA